MQLSTLALSMTSFCMLYSNEFLNTSVFVVLLANATLSSIVLILRS
jgi:hypothetical protein